MWNFYCLQGNRDDSDVLMYYTTTGWMMWNWMVSALALGKGPFLYYVRAKGWVGGMAKYLLFLTGVGGWF